MSLAEVLLAEYDQEMATTRRLFERVPDDKLDFKPHEKSMTMAHLTGHIGELPTWVNGTLEQDELDMAPPGGPKMEAAVTTSRAQLLADFDRVVAAGRDSLAKAEDAEFAKPWSLLMGGEVLFTMPKGACIRTWVMNHLVHHRGQLSVYLRLNNIPVPQIYGPSADEQGM